jgi:hypothetical protein
MKLNDKLYVKGIYLILNSVGKSLCQTAYRKALSNYCDENIWMNWYLLGNFRFRGNLVDFWIIFSPRLFIQKIEIFSRNCQKTFTSLLPKILKDPLKTQLTHFIHSSINPNNFSFIQSLISPKKSPPKKLRND